MVTSGVSAGQVRGDSDQLGRVVRNLLDNALRHASSTVALSVSHGRLVVPTVDGGARFTVTVTLIDTRI